MMSLTCRNIGLGRAKLDLVRYGCSSNGSFYMKWICGGDARKSGASKGRYDVYCLMMSAWDLHKSWPEAELKVAKKKSCKFEGVFRNSWPALLHRLGWCVSQSRVSFRSSFLRSKDELRGKADYAIVELLEMGVSVGGSTTRCGKYGWRRPIETRMKTPVDGTQLVRRRRTRQRGREKALPVFC
ncbi:hypothetical protein Sjap_026142 [Stephania japonica]|uniref:Uncharacterized protein n=1 Tax=Stephania japonica TaxID=461633 RepID=A0AAP0E328_9MAGN